MQEQLTYRPTGWGDPVWSGTDPGAVMYHRYHPLMAVLYGVSADRTAVAVRNVILPPGSPLAETAGEGG